MTDRIDRRRFLKLSGGAAAIASFPYLSGCATTPAKARVVVVGGGYGGATVAKYIRMWDPAIEVVMVERADAFVSCPISNLVLGGSKSMADITHGYTGLQRHGASVVHDDVTAIDADKRIVRLARGSELGYDRLARSYGPGGQR